MYFDWDFGWIITPMAVVAILLVGVAEWGADMAARKFPGNRAVNTMANIVAFVAIIPLALLAALIATSLCSPIIWVIYCVFIDCR
jgi:hypothetical protein